MRRKLLPGNHQLLPQCDDYDIREERFYCPDDLFMARLSAATREDNVIVILLIK